MTGQMFTSITSTSICINNSDEESVTPKLPHILIKKVVNQNDPLKLVTPNFK